MRRYLTRIAIVAAVVVVVGATAVGVGVGVGVATDDDDPAPVVVPGKLAAAAPTTTTLPPTTTTTVPTPPPPPPVPALVGPLPDPGLRGIGRGSPAELVLPYEQRLADLRFDPGPVDGRYDEWTQHAVEALQKMHGAEPNGRIGGGEALTLALFQWPVPLTSDTEPDRVEVSLDQQYLVVYRGGQVALMSTVSSGSGKRFCGGNDGCQYATTPAGRFEFQWHHAGWRNGDLGRLYSPWYFNGGIAVHGYPSVPTTPASHGCVRIPMHTSDLFSPLVWQGMPIYVIGQPAGPFGKARSGETPPPAPAYPAFPPPTTAPPTTTTTTTTVPPAVPAPPVPPPPVPGPAPTAPPAAPAGGAAPTG